MRQVMITHDNGQINLQSNITDPHDLIGLLLEAIRAVNSRISQEKAAGQVQEATPEQKRILLAT